MLKELINKLSQTTSINKKKKILKTIKNNDKILLLLHYTYNPLYQFYIKKFNSTTFGKRNINEYLDALLTLLDKLRNRIITGNKAISEVHEFLSYFDKESQQIIKNIIKKDLKCGINIKLINKVFPNLIPSSPYMGAVPFDKKKVDKLFKTSSKVIAQVKKDGMFVNVIATEGEVDVTSRKGKKLYLSHIFEDDIKTHNLFGYVFNGELMLKGFDRYTANGIIRSYVTIQEKLIQSEFEDSKFVKKVKKDIEKFENKYKITLKDVEDKLYIVVWDCIPVVSFRQGEYTIPYFKRLYNLEIIISQCKKFELIESKEVKNYYEALKYFKQCLNKGEEGIILKSADVRWKDGKPNEQIKFKIEMDVDLQVVAVEYGNEGTKYENLINRIVCLSSDGKVKTVTSGMDEDTMCYLTENKDTLIGKIVTVKCSGLSQDRDGNWSLLHPRFVCLRDDKDEADDFERIKQIERMCFELEE